MASNINILRKNICDIEAEIKAFHSALLPVEDYEITLRTTLEELAGSRSRLISFASDVFNGGNVADVVPLSADIARHAFGLAIHNAGIEKIISEAKKRALSNESPEQLRMSAGERDDRLQELARELYETEMEEESQLNGTPRRSRVNAAAVLQIPVDVAEKFGLLRRKI